MNRWLCLIVGSIVVVAEAIRVEGLECARFVDPRQRSLDRSTLHIRQDPEANLPQQ
ncbi:MAG: hypothetical protein R3Y66_07770 [Rikenellaceae bacterium]